MLLLRKVDFYTVNSGKPEVESLSGDAVLLFFLNLLLFCAIVPNEPIKASELFVDVTFLSLRSYLSSSTASALPSTRQRHKKNLQLSSKATTALTESI